MKTYKDINEFILDVFPVKIDEIIKQEDSDIQKFIEEADTEFEQKLEAIIAGSN